MAHHRLVRAVLVAIPLALLAPAAPAWATTSLGTQLVSANPSQEKTIKDLRAQVKKLNTKVTTLQKQLKAAKAELARVKATTTTTTTTAPAPTTTRPPATTVAPDCTAPCANANGFKVMVTNYKFNVSSGNQFIQPEAGNVYIQLDVTFVNNSKKSESASPFDFKLQDGAGVTRTAELIGPCESWSSANLAVGASFGPKCLAFQATASAPTGLTLEWKPGLFTAYKIPLS